MSDPVNDAAFPELKDILQGLEAYVTEDIRLCQENAEKLLKECTLDSLVDLCGSTRMAWASIYRVSLSSKEEYIDRMVKDFLYVIQLGLTGANDLICKLADNPIHSEKAKKYVENIKIRRDFASILVSKGIEAVDQYIRSQL